MRKPIEINDRVRADINAPDSFYLQVEGAVTAIKNGYAQIQADRVRDRYSKQWKNHLSSCSTAAKIENVTPI